MSAAGDSNTPIPGATANPSAPRGGHELIAAGRVNGTAVYNPAGERIGTIEDVMIEKRSGQVRYAVMGSGGFLGIGERHRPLPWSVLTYDPRMGGYVVELTREQLEGAPSHAADEAPDWHDQEFGRRVHDYYGVRPYWDSSMSS